MAMLLGILKFYVLTALLPCLVFMFWVRKTGSEKVISKFIVVIAATIILGLTINKVIPSLNPLQLLSQKQHDFISLASGKQVDAYNKVIPSAGSNIQIHPLEPTVKSFLINAPQAFVNALFRPFVWELKSSMLLMAGIENVLVFLFVIFCLLFAKPINAIKWEYVLFCLTFVFIQLLFIGFTTPIIGAIVRYKVSALPFLLIAFLLILDKEKIKKRFSFVA